MTESNTADFTLEKKKETKEMSWSYLPITPGDPVSGVGPAVAVYLVAITELCHIFGVVVVSGDQVPTVRAGLIVVYWNNISATT